MELKNKEILMVLSHCDDEIICGWPIFQDKNIKKKIIIASSDLNNSNRIWCSHRKFIFNEICKFYNIESWCLDYDSEFSFNELQSKFLKNDLISLIKKINFDYIFTHNFYGEYGHPDHIFLFKLIHKYYPNRTIISDIKYNDLKNPLQNYSKQHLINLRSKYFKNKIYNARVNKKTYSELRDYYKEFNVWTWNNDFTQDKTSLYLV